MAPGQWLGTRLTIWNAAPWPLQGLGLNPSSRVKRLELPAHFLRQLEAPEVALLSVKAHRTSLCMWRSWWSGDQGSIPANHLLIPVHRDVGPRLVIVRSKVTVGGSKPLVESVLQGVELRPVAQVPGDSNPGHFRELHSATILAFGEQLSRQGPASPGRTESGVLRPQPLPAWPPRNSRGEHTLGLPGPGLVIVLDARAGASGDNKRTWRDACRVTAQLFPEAVLGPTPCSHPGAPSHVGSFCQRPLRRYGLGKRCWGKVPPPWEVDRSPRVTSAWLLAQADPR